MPRPRKFRKVCCLPEINSFGPINTNEDIYEHIVMSVDEYETIRLIDFENFTQEECSKQMNVARTKVQGIYNDARKKLADSIVNGTKLFIEGEEFQLCDGLGSDIKCGKGCHKRRQNHGIGSK